MPSSTTPGSSTGKGCFFFDQPQRLLAGVIGTGKSAFAKSIATRSLAFGIRVYVPGDPKGEWTAVTRAVGGTALTLGQGQPTRLNPLDEGRRPAGLTDQQWDAAIAKIILGGGSNARDLADLATLIGERDDHTLAVSRGSYGEKSTSTSVRRVPVMDTSRLRTLPFGTAVLLLRTAPPIVLDLTPWTARRDARTLTTARAAIEERFRAGAVDHRAAMGA